MPKLESSAVDRVEYSERKSTLSIWYRGGGQYTYYGVPPHIYHALLQTPSIGSFISSRVKSEFATSPKVLAFRARPENMEVANSNERYAEVARLRVRPHVRLMPVVSLFFGIVIRMYHDDHPPPHFHASYQGFEAFVAIETGEILHGQLPKRAARIVRQWAMDRADELMANWERGEALLPMEMIPGADVDD